MNDTSRQIFALLSFLVTGAIIALLIGHAQATGQLLVAGIGGFNTLLNTIENPGGSSSSLGSTLTDFGSALTGVGNLATGINNLTTSIGGIGGSSGGSAGGDFGGG